MRRPAMGPGFTQLGLTLVSPKRSQVSVSGRLDIVVDNPRRAQLIAVAQESNTLEHRCDTNRERTRITCELPSDGRYIVMLYGAAGEEARSLPHIGRIFVNSR